MSTRFHLPGETPSAEGEASVESLQRALRNLRYIVAAIDDDALRAWGDLWTELKDGVTPAGAVTPEMEQGFKPAGGWPDFLEKFWLLKHYLDSIHRFCTSPMGEDGE